MEILKHENIFFLVNGAFISQFTQMSHVKKYCKFNSTEIHEFDFNKFI